MDFLDRDRNYPPLKYFNRDEFDSPDEIGSGKNMDSAFLHQLDKARDIAGIPFKINSGYRTPDYNKKIGGAAKSQHLTASAADIRMNVTPGKVQEGIKELMEEGKIKKGGLGIYANFTHYDIGKHRTW